MEAPLGLPLSDRSFQYIALAVLALLAFALAFTLAAVWLRVANLREERRWARLEASWEPLILAVLADELPESDLHAVVRRKDRRYFVGFLLRYARRLKGAEHDSVLRIAAPYLYTLDRDLKRRSPEKRARALQTLGELSVAEHDQAFLNALTDPSALVAMTAAQALAKHHDPACAERLLRCLERFQHWNLGFLASMLSDLGPESATRLRQAFGDSERPARVRAVIGMTLASLNDLESAGVAARVTETESQTDLLISALALLEKFGSGEHLSVVRRLAESENGPVRARALRALASLADPEDTDRVKTALHDESTWVVLHAARALGTMGRTDVLEQVANSDHPNALVAQEVLWEMRA